MNIKGIGTDIVNRQRIASVYQRFGQRLVNRLLATSEQQQLQQHRDPAGYLSKRFAAKEAVAKALGTGIGAVAFKEIVITSLETGQPQVHFIGKALMITQRMGIKNVLLSLADEKEYALAFAVVTG